MAKLITTTYEIVTPESAEQGDVEERGWIDQEGVDFEDPDNRDDEDQSPVDAAIEWLDNKLSEGSRGREASSSSFHPGIWYTAYGVDDEYGEESRSYHLYGWTEDEERAIYQGVTGRRNPGRCGNPGTADTWNAGLQAGKVAKREGRDRSSYAVEWNRYRDYLVNQIGYRQRDLENAERNFIHAFQLAFSDNSPQLSYGGSMMNPVMNGRSYVRRGVPPPRYWEPKPGDVVYIEGVRTRLGTPSRSEPDMFPLKPPVHGTVAMSGRNIKAVARIEEGERNPRDMSATRDWEDAAFEAGKLWGSHGSHESGVSNANVRHYGFVKWWNNLTPQTARRVRKSSLERAFNEGYKIGRKTPSWKSGQENPYIKGSDLNDRQRRMVLSAYTNRHYAIGPGKRYANDDEWIMDHAFAFTADGRRLSARAKFAEPYYMADELNRRRGNPGQRSSQVDHPMASDLAQFARWQYSRRAQHIKAVQDLMDKYRKRGKYDPAKAVKAYWYVIEGAWKEYKREYPGYHNITNGTKMEAARRLQEMVEEGQA